MQKSVLVCAIILAIIPVFSSKHVIKSTQTIDISDLDLPWDQLAKLAPGGSIVPSSEANANVWVDAFLEKLRPFLIEHNLDPFPIVDIEAEFGWSIFMARIKLTNGLLWDVSTVRRKGDSSLGYEHDIINLVFDVEFADLKADFHYSATFAGFGPGGIIKAKITEQELTMGILVDLALKQIHLQKFELINNGVVSIDITGLTAIGNLIAEGFINALTLLFHDTIVGIIAGQMKNFIENVFDQINNGGILY